MRFHASRCAALTASIALVAVQASAVPTAVVGVDTPLCDPLAVPTQVEELGNPPVFPGGEIIASGDVPTEQPACPVDVLQIPNALVSITNLNPIAFSDLWYVADPETSLSNPDGLVNGMPAFEIDAVGVNTPLVFESLVADGIFAPGETWQFIIQDYANVQGVPASAFGSISVPSSTPGALDGSSGSIIGLPIPEPTSAALLGLGLTALAVRRRARG